MITTNYIQTTVSWFIIVVGLLTSCKKTNHVSVDKSNLKVVTLARLVQTGPLNLSDHVHQTHYIFLHGLKDRAIQIDKIAFNHLFIYILDKKVNLLFIFNREGGLQRVIQGVTAFNLYHNRLFVYNATRGVMRICSLSGHYGNQVQIGFHGIDFAKTHDSLFVFYTGGLRTIDKGSEQFELAFVDAYGEFKYFAIPVSKQKQGINYAALQRFSIYNDSLYFIPSLGYDWYEITKNHIRLKVRFNFGLATLQDSQFSTFKDVKDYHFFPYLINLTNRFNSSEFSFFSFTYKGAEGYFLLNHSGKVLQQGMASVASISSDFNNTVPRSTYQGEYVAVLSDKEFQDNIAHIKKLDSVLANSADKKWDQGNNPVLLFYRLTDQG